MKTGFPLPRRTPPDRRPSLFFFCRADDLRCRRIVRRWRRQQRREARRARARRRLQARPGWHALGQLFYYVGFLTEYWLLCLWRGAAASLLLCLRLAAELAGAFFRPMAQASCGLDSGIAVPTRRRLLPWLAPLAAAALFAAVVRFGLALPFVLRVEVGGELIGYVASEKDFEAARADVTGRINNAKAILRDAGAPAAQGAWEVWPTYTLAPQGGKTMTENELVEALLRASGGEVSEGTAVYIDGALCFVTTEGDHLRSFLARLLAPYEGGTTQERQVGFAHRLRLVDGLFLQASVVSYGTVLETLQADGGALLQVQVNEESTYEEEIPFSISEQESSAIPYGQTEIRQEGKNGRQRVTQVATYVDGRLTDTTISAIEVLEPPVEQVVAVGTRLPDGMTATTGDGYTFIWPVPRYRSVSQWMNSGHTGTDIAANAGTPILASASGTVSTAYHWNGIRTRGDWNSYGNYVVLDHDGGYQTLYAHMTFFVVSEGEYVEQGQVIGYVGNTGYSFGAHCHFELFRNGVRFSARELFPTMRRW